MSEAASNAGLRVALKVFTVFRYLKMRHPEKNIYDYGLPIALAGILTCIDACFFDASVLIAPGIMLSKPIAALLLVFTGVFTAAMGVVAALDSPSLRSRTSVVLDDSKITRRTLVMSIFAYLSVLSLTLYCASTMLEIGSTWFMSWTLGWRIVLAAIYYGLLSQLGSVTLVGLHYLTDEAQNGSDEAQNGSDEAQNGSDEAQNGSDEE